jgi:hypothetical protein
MTGVICTCLANHYAFSQICRMAHYLLLGAGFSRNWGGWLAAEVFEYLLGRPEVVGNAPLRRMLWEAQSNGGFEYALETLQVAASRDDREAVENLANLQAAVVAMFNDMNEAFDGIQFEGQQHNQFTVSTFLTKFEAIFTLNQDLLVERHYLSQQPNLRNAARWDGAAMPGVQSTGTPPASIVGQRWRIQEEGEFKVSARVQPYFKLHGSTNWDAPDGSNTLIIGGNKSTAIGGTPILKWYFDQFQQMAMAGDSRRMIIGYGFRDRHINDILIKAINERGLKIFVISPAGASQAREVNRSYGATIFAKEPLDDAFEVGLIGASQRVLSEIFRASSPEFGKIQRFFDG